MSDNRNYDNRNYGGYGRGQDRDEASRERGFGRADERSARRGAGYSQHDGERSRSDYQGSSDRGYDDRDGRRQGGSESRESYYGGDYGRGSSSGDHRGSSGDYLSNAGRGYGRSSYGGVDFDRSERGFGADHGYASRAERSDAFRSGASGFNQGRGDYGETRRARTDSNRPGERSFFDRAGDEISSWFGDEEAEHRRDQDRRHAGKGPKSYTRSDDRIKEDINDRLTEDHRIDASDIEVSVKDREVTLTGHVSSRDDKRRAEDIAERVSGVNHVQNNLRVQSSAGGGSYGQTTATGSSLGSGATGTSSATGTTQNGTTTGSTTGSGVGSTFGRSSD